MASLITNDEVTAERKIISDNITIIKQKVKPVRAPVISPFSALILDDINPDKKLEITRIKVAIKPETLREIELLDIINANINGGG